MQDNVETQWTLPTSDGHLIYGVLNSRSANDKAVIYVHGLTGWAYEYVPSMIAQEFPLKGYDVIRINLYDAQDKARQLIDCTLNIHASDINTVINYYQSKYSKLFAVGHSYGGPSLVLSDIDQLTAISLTDPTYVPKESFKIAQPAGDYYFRSKGGGVIIGKAFYDEAMSCDIDWARQISKKITTPIQMVYADKGIRLKEGESYHTHAQSETDEVVIEGTVHCFVEGNTTQQLLDKIYDWFERF